MGKGSCRSWGGINLFELLMTCGDLLESFGGHALAAGFMVREENIPALAQRLRQGVLEQQAGQEPPSVLETDGIVQPQQLDVASVEALDALGSRESDYYVILTRGHAHDRDCLEHVLRGKYAYAGMIGSRTKVAAVKVP